ncbi:hypothetical protein Acr_25g0006850 [Actinidia rufa]|uniref:Uncharacterized protein n=1 Tax=Actinidia rufa TaxID=165716 RepID=A0A7J0GZQ4_9ERIC|nr:hypothetical protein Acr_25g0006850 [Actinidia rufa]
MPRRRIRRARPTRGRDPSKPKHSNRSKTKRQRWRRLHGHRKQPSSVEETTCLAPTTLTSRCSGNHIRNAVGAGKVRAEGQRDTKAGDGNNQASSAEEEMEEWKKRGERRQAGEDDESRGAEEKKRNERKLKRRETWTEGEKKKPCSGNPRVSERGTRFQSSLATLFLASGLSFTSGYTSATEVSPPIVSQASAGN